MKQNYYELMYILRPDLSEEQENAEIEKYRSQLTELGASDLQTQVRGKRRLAYPIQNFQDGIYVQLNYTAPGAHVAPVERAMRLSESVIRYLTLIIDAPEAKPEAEETEVTA